MKKLVFAITITILIQAPVNAKKFKICEIIYGETDLSKKSLTSNLSSDMNKNGLTKCIKIGVEYDTNQKRREDKPIYACCLDRKEHEKKIMQDDE